MPAWRHLQESTGFALNAPFPGRKTCGRRGWSREQRAATCAPDAWPEMCGAVWCSPAAAAGRLQQEQIRPFPKDSPTRVKVLWFFPPAGLRLGRVCLLLCLFQNPVLNKSSSIGPVVLLSSAAGWWCSLPVPGRAAPGSRMSVEPFPLGCSVPFTALWESSWSGFYRGNISKAIMGKKERFFINTNNSNGSSSNNNG